MNDRRRTGREPCRRRRTSRASRARSSTAPPAAPRRTGIPTKQALICPFCGTESPATLRRRGGRDRHRRARPGGGAARHSRSARGWQAEKIRSAARAARRSRSSMPRRSASAAILRLVVARALRAGQGRVPAGVAAAAEDLRAAGARSDPRVVRPPVARAERASATKALTDTVQGRLPARTGRSTRTVHARLDGRIAATTTTCSEGNQQRAAGPLVRRPPARCRTSFDDELVCCVARRVAAGCCGGSSRFRPPTLVPYDAGYLSGWTVERYQIDLVAAAERSRAADGRRSARRCARGRSRATRTAICRCDATYQRPDVQAHPRAGLAADATYYGRTSYQVVVNGVTGTHRRRAAVELDQDRAAGAPGPHRTCGDRVEPVTILPPRFTRLNFTVNY